MNKLGGGGRGHEVPYEAKKGMEELSMGGQLLGLHKGGVKPELSGGSRHDVQCCGTLRIAKELGR